MYWSHWNIQSVDSLRESAHLCWVRISSAAHRRVGVLQVNNTWLSDKHTNQNVWAITLFLTRDYYLSQTGPPHNSEIRNNIGISRNNGLLEFGIKATVGKMGCQNNGVSEQQDVGITSCRNNGLSEKRADPFQTCLESEIENHWNMKKNLQPARWRGKMVAETKCF